MKSSPLFLLIPSVFLTAAIVCAQTANSNESLLKRDKHLAFQNNLLEKISKDTLDLNLPENRARAYAQLGRIYWKIDETRARQLFRSSVDNLLIAQKEVVSDKGMRPTATTLESGEARQMILRIITQRDEKLGHEMFITSRPDKITNAFLGIPPKPPTTFYDNGISPAVYIVRGENLLEETLAILVIPQNPAWAIDILRRERPNGLTGFTYNLLKALRGKDKQTADTILAEIINRILESDFKKDSSGLSFAGQLLAEASTNIGKSDFSGVSPVVLRALAEKLAIFLTDENNTNIASGYLQFMSVIRKFTSEQTEQIIRKAVLPTPFPTPYYPVSKEAEDLLRNEDNAEKLLQEAEKFPPLFRDQIYMKALNIFVREDKEERMRQFLNQRFTPQTLPEVLNNLDIKIAYRAIEKGEFDKALGLIEKSDEMFRFNALITLAKAMIYRNPTDPKKAEKILDRLRYITSQRPTTKRDFTNLGELATVYVRINPKISFRLLETLIEKYSENREATAIVNTYSESAGIQRGEFIINSYFNQDSSELSVVIKAFAEANLEKTLKAINKIRRPDIKIPLELELAETAFNP